MGSPKSVKVGKQCLIITSINVTEKRRCENVTFQAKLQGKVILIRYNNDIFPIGINAVSQDSLMTSIVVIDQTGVAVHAVL